MLMSSYDRKGHQFLSDPSIEYMNQSCSALLSGRLWSFSFLLLAVLCRCSSIAIRDTVLYEKQLWALFIDIIQTWRRRPQRPLRQSQITLKCPSCSAKRSALTLMKRDSSSHPHQQRLRAHPKMAMPQLWKRPSKPWKSPNHPVIFMVSNGH